MKKLILAAAILAMASFAQAETVTWSYPESNNSEIDGFVLYEMVDGAVVEVARLADPTARVWILDLGDFIGPRGFFMAAYGDNGQIGNYGDLFVKPPFQEPPQFRIIPMDKVEGLIIRD